MEDFLRDSNSSLKAGISKIPIEEMLTSLEVANETDVGVDIRNIGLLMFGDSPEKFIPGAQIDLVHFHTPEAEGSDDFTEKVFTGPIQKQIRDALSYINAVLLVEKVVKLPRRAEAERFFNYPFEALEEILVNAVFHKSYRDPEPVEIRIYVDCIQIINYPGPEKWIDMEKFATGKVRARRYRNRRIGEFLKEIDLSEKQSTGITKILRVLEQNGSPPPEFETDEDRHYLIVTIHPHEGFKANGTANGLAYNSDDGISDGFIGENPIIEKSAQNNERSLSELLSGLLSRKDYEKVLPIIHYFDEYETIKPSDAESLLGKSSATTRRYLGILVNAGVLVQQGKANATIYRRVKL